MSNMYHTLYNIILSCPFYDTYVYILTRVREKFSFAPSPARVVWLRLSLFAPTVLHIDHVNGKGEVERRAYGSLTFYARIINGKRKVTDLQILCANCHSIKTYHE